MGKLLTYLAVLALLLVAPVVVSAAAYFSARCVWI